jgi:hypothetical protein
MYKVFFSFLQPQNTSPYAGYVWYQWHWNQNSKIQTSRSAGSTVDLVGLFLFRSMLRNVSEKALRRYGIPNNRHVYDVRQPGREKINARSIMFLLFLLKRQSGQCLTHKETA